LFTHADIFYRQTDLLPDCHHHSPFSRTVELGQYDSCAIDRFGEFVRLTDAILTGGCIEDQ